MEEIERDIHNEVLSSSEVSPHDRLLPPKWTITVLIVIALYFILSELKALLFLLFVAYLVSYLIDPALIRLRKLGIQRTYGVGILYISFLLLIAIIIAVIVPIITDEIQVVSESIVSALPHLEETSENLVQSLSPYLPNKISQALQKESSQMVRDGLLFVSQSLSAQTIKNSFSQLLTVILAGYSFTLTLLNLAILPVIVFYLSKDFWGLNKACLHLCPLKYRNQFKRVCSQIDQILRAFFKGQLLVGAILSVLYFTGYFILGLPLSLLVALMSGFGIFIPYVGPLIGGLSALIISLVTHSTFANALGVLGVMVTVQLLEGFVITPKVVGDKVGLSPLAVILSVIAFGTLFGIAGVALAVPMAATLKVLYLELKPEIHVST